MIIPSGHRVLVKQETFVEHDEVYKRAKAAGIELSLDRGVKAQESVDIGDVVSIGQTAWKDYGGSPWAEVGDRVVFAKFAGKSVEDPEDPDGHYVIINDEDICCVIK